LTSGFAIDSRVAMSLSFTELKIASLIKNGITTEEIARQLHIAESTVRTHRKNIHKKLKINNALHSLRNFLNSGA
jgi:DNA-binding CsgD family transcriptional regulator